MGSLENTIASCFYEFNKRAGTQCGYYRHFHGLTSGTETITGPYMTRRAAEGIGGRQYYSYEEAKFHFCAPNGAEIIEPYKYEP